jgi:hypothetical protein
MASEKAKVSEICVEAKQNQGRRVRKSQRRVRGIHPTRYGKAKNVTKRIFLGMSLFSREK